MINTVKTALEILREIGEEVTIDQSRVLNSIANTLEQEIIRLEVLYYSCVKELAVETNSCRDICISLKAGNDWHGSANTLKTAIDRLQERAKARLCK